MHCVSTYRNHLNLFPVGPVQNGFILQVRCGCWLRRNALRLNMPKFSDLPVSAVKTCFLSTPKNLSFVMFLHD
jgi:hypothetical protein